MTQTPLQMADIYNRLASLGFPKKFIQQKILPDWWSEEVDATPGVLTEGALYISRRLNLDVRSLLASDSQPTFESASQPKFKLKAGTEEKQLRIPRALAARIAELVAYGCKRVYEPLDGLSVAEIRQQMMKNRADLDLKGFLDFCWQRGIPVVHFAEFPPRVHRFQGMVGYFYNRPVILVSLKKCFSAWLLFIAAHELGHILKAHIHREGNDVLLVDEEIELTTSDREEDEANQIAAELLLGKSGISYDVFQQFLSGEQLAGKAREFALRDQVNPGVVALNISWNRAQRSKHKNLERVIWGAAHNALKILEPDANAPQEINHYLLQNLDWEKLGDDNQEYLKNMLNLPH